MKSKFVVSLFLVYEMELNNACKHEIELLGIIDFHFGTVAFMKSSSIYLMRENMKSKLLVSLISINDPLSIHEIELNLFNARKHEIELLGIIDFHFQFMKSS